ERKVSVRRAIRLGNHEGQAPEVLQSARTPEGTRCMRILQVIPYFCLSWAPDLPVELVLEMSRSMVRAGHEVSIYTTNAFNRASGCSEVHRTEIDGVRIHEFPSYGRYHLSFSSSLATAVRSEVHEFQL